MVSFSFYDLLDTKTYAPPESVFGHFDLILCRNVLIYFESAYQDIIFDKLFRALAVNGYLILGEVEQLPINYQSYFVQDNDYCQAYRKYRGACQ
jgi:chemotaxis methyl-accepting protein methylase